MQQKSIITFIILFGFAAFILIALALIINQPYFSPDETISCNTLSYNHQKALNLVFFASESDTKTYTDALLSTSPLSKFKEDINIYYIDAVPECKLYKDIAVFCYTRKLVKVASICPNDFIIVLQNQDSSIRSSSYLNVLSLNKNSPLNVIAHEFGHAFSNLAEEYIPAEIPKGSRNCAASCTDFNGLNEGCFKGCSNEEFVRSVEYGIMRTLSSSDFGPFNEKIIEERLMNYKLDKEISSLTGNAVASIDTSSCSELYYLISAKYSDNDLEILSKDIGRGCIGAQGAGSFTYTLSDNKGNSLIEEEFNPETIFTDIQHQEKDSLEGESYTYEDVFYLRIPDNSGMESLKIKDSNNQTAEIKLYDLGSHACRMV